MSEEKYLYEYIDQLTKSVKLYNTIYSVVNKINDFNRHFPIDWDKNDVFGILEYLYDYVKSFNSDSTIRSIIKKNFDELFNNFMKNKLEEIKNNLNECINILGTSILSNNDIEISLSNIIKHIDNCIELDSYSKYYIIFESRKYAKYTDNDIDIIKGYIFKIREELTDTANKLKLPNRKDWEV